MKKITDFIKVLYRKDRVPLHEPVFLGREREYLQECIETAYVSYVGQFVSKFEKMIAEFTGSKSTVAVVNGTAGLHITLRAVGVNYDDEVITQSLTFVATANAISHCGAYPVFIDVDRDTLGMSPESLEYFLKKHTTYDKVRGALINVNTKRAIKAIVPVHVFGHPCRIDQIVRIAQDYGLPVIEDSAEALGSLYKGKHCGTFGLAGIISFNGNKIITTGGGGMVLT
ncbi:MAG: aminotransferase class I/II-fold pyridoxal phosphate-dependent enzyme, partial [Thermodesulfovibrio sp.]|nr:aminotransferase class I/II-fold pyridoxal phosphate-dependent enzyme [Thermodesulfovibrio sp.]